MRLWCRRRVVGSLISACALGGAVPMGCTALVRLPGGLVEVSDAGVFVNFLGASVSVTEALVEIGLPGVKIDVRGAP